MTTTNTCKKCGCEDSFMPSPAPCPTPAGCPTPQPCSEVFDAQCVVYTGDALDCEGNVIIGPNNNVAEAFNNIIDYFCSQIQPQTCAPQVNIVRNSNGLLTATASGGTGSFIFEWVFSSAVNGTSNMFGPPGTQADTPTVSNYGFSRITTPGISPIVGSNGYSTYIGLAKVIATDTAGCVAKDTYLIIDMVTTP